MVERFTNTILPQQVVPQQNSLGVVYVRLYTDINAAIRESSDKYHSAKLLDLRYHLFIDFVAAPTLQGARQVIQLCRRQYAALMTKSPDPSEPVNDEQEPGMGAD